MTDDNTPADGETPEQEPEQETPPDLSAEVDKWKALARKNESRAKENAEKAKKFDELEEANKSEQQKLQDQLAAAQKALADAETGRLRASIAAKHGVPEGLLSGGDEEALEASAQALLQFRGNVPKAPTPDGQGKVGEPIGGAKQITSRDQLKSMTSAQIEEARKSGALDGLLGAKS